MQALPRYVAEANAYARGVADGSIVACKWTVLACRRHLRDLEASLDEAYAYEYSHALAARVCEFVELLPHIKGEWARAGRLLQLEPWQCFILCSAFGWVRRKDGRRRFRDVYVEVPRKNAKSTLSSGVALYMLCADGEAGAEVFSAATSREQARIVFDDAKQMAARSPGLSSDLGLAILQHSLVVRHTASRFAPLVAKGGSLEGLNPHFSVVDELHAHNSRDVYDVLDVGRGARSQPLLWCITTAGSNRAGICYERRQHLTEVLQGVTDDPTTFGIIYTIDADDVWHDPRSWYKANPNLGISVSLDDMEASCRKAQATASAVNNFLTKRLDVWVNAATAWMDMVAWDRCADTSLTPDRVAHLPCVISLDLASKVDVAAAVRIFYDAEADRYFLIPTFWLPERQVEIGSNSQYDGWRRAGHLKVTDGEVTDYDQIEDALRADICTFQVQEIPYDPWQATQLASHMLAEGAPMVEYRQTVQNMSEPMKMLEALVLKPGKLVHDGNPVMTWMISNVVCHRDAKDNVYPRKERDQNKIDGAVAAIMALGRMRQQTEAAPGIY
nr:terminase TerL endonuclease subunit [Variovorax boronicumulans]